MSPLHPGKLLARVWGLALCHVGLCPPVGQHHETLLPVSEPAGASSASSPSILMVHGGLPASCCPARLPWRLAGASKPHSPAGGWWAGAPEREGGFGGLVPHTLRVPSEGWPQSSAEMIRGTPDPGHEDPCARQALPKGGVNRAPSLPSPQYPLSPFTLTPEIWAAGGLRLSCSGPRPC